MASCLVVSLPPPAAQCRGDLMCECGFLDLSLCMTGRRAHLLRDESAAHSVVTAMWKVAVQATAGMVPPDTFGHTALHLTPVPCSGC